MIIDRLNTMVWQTALNTGAAGTYLLADQIDLGAGQARDMGLAGLWFVALVTTTATSGGAATLQLVLASDAQAVITTNGTETRHYTSPTFAVASLVAGTLLCMVPLPAEPPVYERFIGVLQITGTAAFTAGAISAFLTEDPTVWKAYPNAIQ